MAVVPYVKSLRIPLLGARIGGSSILISRGTPSPFVESFRLLALNVRASLKQSSPKGLVVMSAHAGDGRSLIAANLAIALAEHVKTVLMDRDGRSDNPLRKILRVEPHSSLVRIPEQLSANGNGRNGRGLWLDEAARYTAVGIDALDKCISLNSLDGIYSIVDSPPALVSSDAFLLAEKVGHVVYVVRRSSYEPGLHRAVREQLDRLGVKVLGLVLNEF